MALRTSVKDISVHSDPLSFSAGIKILSGNPVQSYNKDERKYVPDRFADKLGHKTLLLPVVSVSDPDGIQNGTQVLVDCEWYEGEPGKGAKITDNEFYHINHPKAKNYNPQDPTWALEVTKNFEPNKPCEIYALFSFIDKRRNELVTIERSIIFRTTYYDLDMLSLQLQDTPTHQRLDPLQFIPNAKGQWLVNFSALLYSGKDPVEEIHSAYWWQTFDYMLGDWRDFTEDERKVFVEGDHTRTLSIDARFVRTINLRCVAARYEEQRPLLPPSSALMETVSFKVEFSKALRADVRQTAGVRISPKMNTRCAFTLDMNDQSGKISEDKDHLFSTVWRAKSERPGSSPMIIGGGRNVDFVPSDINLDLVYSSGISAEVSMHAVNVLLEFEGKILALGNKCITTSKFE